MIQQAVCQCQQHRKPQASGSGETISDGPVQPRTHSERAAHRCIKVMPRNTQKETSRSLLRTCTMEHYTRRETWPVTKVHREMSGIDSITVPSPLGEGAWISAPPTFTRPAKGHPIVAEKSSVQVNAWWHGSSRDARSEWIRRALSSSETWAAFRLD